MIRRPPGSTRTDTLFPDTTLFRSNPGFLLSIGEQRAKGIEASINARPAPGLTLYAGYAYTDAEVSKDTEGRTGNPLRNVPRNTFSFHGNYEVQQGPIAGFSLGARLPHVGRSEERRVGKECVQCRCRWAAFT